MIKKVVTYFDFDNNERTETLYFNLTQTELVDMAMDLPDSVSEQIGPNPTEADADKLAMTMVDSLGKKGIVDFIKQLVLKAYGIKSEDGRRFIKSKEITEEFSQTLAYDAILMELLSNDTAASDFVNSVIPAKVIEKMPAMKQPRTRKTLPQK